MKIYFNNELVAEINEVIAPEIAREVLVENGYEGAKKASYTLDGDTLRFTIKAGTNA